MVSHNDEVVKREQYRDLLRAAEQDHLLRPLKVGPKVALYQRALAGLGRHLVAWGRYLQANFGTANQVSLSAGGEQGRQVMVQ